MNYSVCDDFPNFAMIKKKTSVVNKIKNFILFIFSVYFSEGAMNLGISSAT